MKLIIFQDIEDEQGIGEFDYFTLVWLVLKRIINCNRIMCDHCFWYLNRIKDALAATHNNSKLCAVFRW